MRWLPSRRLQHARRGRSRYLAAAAAFVGLVALVVPPAWASPGPPSSVYDPNQVFWRVLLNRPSSDFAVEFNDLLALGYMVVDLEVEGDGRPTAIWQQNTDGRSWRSRRGLSSTTFAEEHARAQADGMRLVDFEAYRTDPSNVYTPRYAAVWVENREGYSWSFRYGMSASEMNAYFLQQRDAGRMPVDIEKYDMPAGCVDCFAAAWVRNAEGLDWAVHWNLTSAQYSQRFEEYRDHYRPLVVQRNGDHYQGIWVENRNGRGWRSNRNLTLTDVQARINLYRNQGYRPISLEKNRVGDEWRYAVVWRQNN